MTGLLTATSGDTHRGIKVGNTYINAINGELIFQNNGTIRFGGDSWDYNVWAGLKYVHSSKTIYLGLADSSAFTANSAQSEGKLYTPGISDIYIGNGTYKVYHTGNLSIGDGTVTVTQAGNTIGSFTMNQSGNTLIALNDTNTNYYPIRSFTSGLKISSYSGSTDCELWVPNASSSRAGVVSTGTQIFTGAKTFTGAMTVNNTITFGTSNNYGIRTSSDNYCRIGESTKRFYQCYVKNSYSTNGFYEDSDERLKNIVKSVKVDLDELSKLRKIYYIWKNPKEDQSLQLGMIAQDVQKIYPELVSIDKETGYLSLAYDRISVIALEAIDALYEEYKQLKERINGLEKLLHSKEIL